MDIFFEKEIEKIKIVDKEKRYWFVRTYGGEAFQHYYEGGFVGLGLNEVPYKYIIEALPGDTKTHFALQNFIANYYKDLNKGESTRWANQLIAFNHEVKIGDTVVIPTKYSSHLAIGTVVSDVFLVEKPLVIQTKDGATELPEKRRRVNWEKVVTKDEFQGDLRGLLASHWGITNGDDYAEIIEGVLESVFIKNEHTYLVIQIKQDEEINAFDFRNFLNGLTFFYKEFSEEAGAEHSDDLTIKIKVQSKGKTVLKGAIIAGIVGLAGLIVIANESEVDVDLKNMKVKGKSQGVMKSYSDFLDRKQQRQMEWERFKDSLERIKAERNRNLSNDNVTDNVQKTGE